MISQQFSSTYAEALRLPKELLPTMYDLPSEEIGDAGMPDEFHVYQAMLLNETFRPTTVVPEQFFSAIDMNLYYDLSHPTWYKRPDWFGVVGVPHLYGGWDLRQSYVIWQEETPPTIVVELLSPGTEKDDLGQALRDVAAPPPKWEVYERLLRVPYYVVFSKHDDELRIFKLSENGYERILDHHGRLWIEEAGLSLGLWQGRYQSKSDRLWLRWYHRDGKLVLTSEERLQYEQRQVKEQRQRAEMERIYAEQERQRAEQERQRAEQEWERAEQERQRAEQEWERAEQGQREKDAALQKAAQMAAKLRELGIDPDLL